LRLLNTILGENMSSRLFQVLREDRGLAYSIYSSPSFFADTGDLVVSAGLEAGNVPQALRLIAREMRRLRDTALTNKEMKRAREYLLGQIDLNLESTDNQMNWVGEQWLGYGKVLSPEEAKQRILQVTAGEVRECAREFFQANRVNIAMVSPLRPQAALLMDIARQFRSLNGG
jgi:predicted Zn-dependent peptidase